MLCFEQNCGEIDLNTKRRFIDNKYYTYIATLLALWKRPLCWSFALIFYSRFLAFSFIHSFVRHSFIHSCIHSFLFFSAFSFSQSLSVFVGHEHLHKHTHTHLYLYTSPITIESNKWNSITWNPKTRIPMDTLKYYNEWVFHSFQWIQQQPPPATTTITPSQPRIEWMEGFWFVLLEKCIWEGV